MEMHIETDDRQTDRISRLRLAKGNMKSAINLILSVSCVAYSLGTSMLQAP